MIILVSVQHTQVERLARQDILLERRLVVGPRPNLNLQCWVMTQPILEASMRLPRGQDDRYSHSDYYQEQDKEELSRKSHLRKRLEDRLERKRLREQFDELDGEFDWDEFDR